MELGRRKRHNKWIISINRLHTSHTHTRSHLPYDTERSVTDWPVRLDILGDGRRLEVGCGRGQDGALRRTGSSSLYQRHRDTHGDPP